MQPEPSRPSSPSPAYALPSALAAQTKFVRLGSPNVPALIAHPDWTTPRPTVIWMHGRTVSKELDNGRYLRWIRAGFAAVALDLPGHGERFEAALQSPTRTLDVLTQMVGEIDHVIEALADGSVSEANVFDLDRLAIGGMSAGGMCALRRCCEPHQFAAITVEGTAGNLERLYLEPTTPLAPKLVMHDPSKVRGLSAMANMARWRPIPLLALHSEADAVVPVGCMTSFVEALGGHYARLGADPAMLTMRTWPSTGAPDEHNGFGRVAAEAKTIQAQWLGRVLGVAESGGP
ncbi:MAG: alpha/beta fold hydrolase [Phycisphaerales bacterium]|nr:alpha/beta fold hydrolase [Phycisphaerales bacterium]